MARMEAPTPIPIPSRIFSLDDLYPHHKLNILNTPRGEYPCGCNALDFNDNGFCKYCGGV